LENSTISFSKPFIFPKILPKSSSAMDTTGSEMTLAYIFLYSREFPREIVFNTLNLTKNHSRPIARIRLNLCWMGVLSSWGTFYSFRESGSSGHMSSPMPNPGKYQRFGRSIPNTINTFNLNCPAVISGCIAVGSRLSCINRARIH
jgi:hypothetical protein